MNVLYIESFLQIHNDARIHDEVWLGASNTTCPLAVEEIADKDD